MKKIKLLIIFVICLFIVNVRADVAPPSLVEHEVMVTNKNGAICYEYNGSKWVKDEDANVIPYKTTLKVIYDIVDSYITVTKDDEYSCYVKYADVSAVNQNFNLNNDQVEKINSVRAIVLPSGGVNLRKGPSVTYSKITTVPQYSAITLTHRAGDYWYYTKYNGNLGWITGINGYLGREDSKVLYSNKAVKIYDSKGKAIGTIPANTPIEKYLVINGDNSYYVIYNNIKGYISDDMYIKVDEPGKIKLTKDQEIGEDSNGNPIKRIKKGTELEYTMISSYGIGFYVPSQNEMIYLETSEFEYVKKAVVSTKKSGYIGEGLFGEAKEERTDPIKPSEPEEDPVIPEEEKKGLSTRDIVIIGLLGGIFLALTALVIIKLVNSKKKTTVKREEPVINKVSEEEIEKARAIVAKELEKEEQEENKEV